MQNCHTTYTAEPAEDLTMTSDSIHCRICQVDTGSESLISPCNCKGTMAYVHRSCLETWLTQSSKSKCELCKYSYLLIHSPCNRFFVETRRWLSNHNRCADTLTVTIMTAITVLHVIFCVVLLDFVASKGLQFGISLTVIRMVDPVLLILLNCGYVWLLYAFLKLRSCLASGGIWKNPGRVRLVLDKNQATTSNGQKCPSEGVQNQDQKSQEPLRDDQIYISEENDAKEESNKANSL